MQVMNTFAGCNASNAAGCAARYREWASDDIISLATCFWRQHAFFSLGEQPIHLFDLELPNEFSVACTQRDWCGRSYRYAWENDAVNVEIRTSLPGPLFQIDNTHLRLKTFTGSEWRDFKDLQSGQVIDSHGAESIEGGRIYFVSSDKVPALVICSQPLKRFGNITHRHYDFEFAEAGAKVLVVPLLTEDDVPSDEETIQQWLRIVESPSIHIEESFSLEDDAIKVTGKGNANTIFLSPMLSLLGEKDNLVSDLSVATPLVTSWCGPYSVIDASEYSFAINAKWLFAKAATGSSVSGAFTEIPEEMSCITAMSRNRNVRPAGSS